MSEAPSPGWRGELHSIASLAWPVFVGQAAVLAFSTIDTVLLARHDARDLAALAVGAAAYVSVFIGLMGIVLAIGPIAGRAYGARNLAEAGARFQQAVWLALALSVPGCALLAFPDPFLALARTTPEVDSRARDYLSALALALPPALCFAAFRGFNTAVSRPKAVMALQLGALALKLPLSATLVFGVPELGWPALGVQGCGIATTAVVWLQALVAGLVLRQDPFYTPFRLKGLQRPEARALAELTKLGVPMGLSILVEVTGFTFMAFFIARLGTLAVAGHQVAANLTALLYMLPLAIGNACGTLVAQRIGAGDLVGARRLGWHGVQLAWALALASGGLVLLGRASLVGFYTGDPAVATGALPLLGWVALFHLGDALQVVAAFVLRAWHVATLPLLIYAGAVWGIGLGGGYALVFGLAGGAPVWPAAPAFWAAATVGLLAAAAALVLLMRRAGCHFPGTPHPGR